MRTERRVLLASLLLTVSLAADPSEALSQVGPPTRLVVAVDPPWPGVRIEAVGLASSGVTGQDGTVTLAVRGETVELRGTTPDGEVVSRLVDVRRWNDQVTLSFPGLRAIGASVLVRTLPGAEVTLDGRPTLPVDERGELTIRGLVPGRHVIRIREPGSDRTVSRTVTASTAGPSVLTVRADAWVSEVLTPSTEVPSDASWESALEGIPPGTGVVSLEASERILVLLGDATLGWSGPDEPIRVRLPAGHAELLLSHPSGERRQFPVEVPDGALLRVTAEWVPSQTPSASWVAGELGAPLALGLGIALSLTLGLAARTVQQRRRPPELPDPRSGPDGAGLGEAVSGSRFDSYTLLRYLGRGGMAAVYEAVNAEGVPCALKILEGSARSDEDLRRRFLREARVLEKLHASVPDAPVVRAFRHGTEHGQPEGIPFIELELIRGRTLLECVKAHGPPPHAVTLHILAEITRGLAAAHACGVLHRDLTPDNVLLENEHASVPTVRVIDFGVAKHDHTQVHTLDGSVFGKPPYMAPEVWQHATVDARTDLYALGMLGYLLLTGEAPFSDPNPIIVMRMHEEVDPPELPSAVPLEFQRVLRRLVRKSPEHRYPDAGAVLSDLAEISAQPSLSFSRKGGS